MEETGSGPSVPPSTPDPLGLDRLGLDRIGLDRIGLIQSIGGLVLGLIALFSSYDHITFAGRSIPLQQQWGIPFIFNSHQSSPAPVLADAAGSDDGAGSGSLKVTSDIQELINRAVTALACTDFVLNPGPWLARKAS